ncbi:hypothetical protein VTI28DRAFT_2604 [Corynascus sepedonium]
MPGCHADVDADDGKVERGGTRRVAVVKGVIHGDEGSGQIPKPDGLDRVYHALIRFDGHITAHSHVIQRVTA